LCARQQTVDSKKTHAAEFLTHGKRPFYRPDGSLKIAAGSLRNFPVEYAKEELGVEKAGSVLGEILCNALIVMDNIFCTLQKTSGSFVETAGNFCLWTG
jgi:hypothetical protein